MKLKPKHQRFAFICVTLALLGSGAYFVINALQENMVFFLTPSEIKEKDIDKSRPIRLGGLVENGSLKKLDDGLSVEFMITDLKMNQKVHYSGALPDLFREGQGVVANGKFSGELFQAKQILAKHDENYMPPQIANTIKQNSSNK